MMAHIIQAEYDYLADFMRSFSEEADGITELDRMIQRSLNMLRNGGWTGEASQAFLAEMDSVVLPAVRRLIAALHESSSATRRLSEIFQDAEEEAGALFQGKAAIEDTDKRKAKPVSGGGDGYKPADVRFRTISNDISQDEDGEDPPTNPAADITRDGAGVLGQMAAALETAANAAGYPGVAKLFGFLGMVATGADIGANVSDTNTTGLEWFKAAAGIAIGAISLKLGVLGGPFSLVAGIFINQIDPSKSLYAQPDWYLELGMQYDPIETFNNGGIYNTNGGLATIDPNDWYGPSGTGMDGLAAVWVLNDYSNGFIPPHRREEAMVINAGLMQNLFAMGQSNPNLTADSPEVVALTDTMSYFGMNLPESMVNQILDGSLPTQWEYSSGSSVNAPPSGYAVWAWVSSYANVQGGGEALMADIANNPNAVIEGWMNIANDANSLGVVAPDYAETYIQQAAPTPQAQQQTGSTLLVANMAMAGTNITDPNFATTITENLNDPLFASTITTMVQDYGYVPRAYTRVLEDFLYTQRVPRAQIEEILGTVASIEQEARATNP
jgi:WXG100 family type VII secretion target